MQPLGTKTDNVNVQLIPMPIQVIALHVCVTETKLGLFNQPINFGLDVFWNGEKYVDSVQNFFIFWSSFKVSSTSLQRLS